MTESDAKTGGLLRRTQKLLQFQRALRYAAVSLTCHNRMNHAEHPFSFLFSQTH